MKPNNKTSRPRCASRTMLASSNGTHSFVHPTLARPQIADIDNQIRRLEQQFDRRYNNVLYRLREFPRLTLYERLEPEVSLARQISLLYEERSRLQLRFGHSSAAFASLCRAVEVLFDGGCWILNSCVGYGHPQVARFYYLEACCRDLCRQYPHLWPAYHNSLLPTFLFEQDLWPCE